MLLKRGREFSPRASLAQVAVSVAALLGLVFAGSLTPRWIAFAQEEPRLPFEAASIKASDAGHVGAQAFSEATLIREMLAHERLAKVNLLKRQRRRVR